MKPIIITALIITVLVIHSFSNDKKLNEMCVDTVEKVMTECK